MLSKMDTSLISCATQPTSINVSPLVWGQTPLSLVEQTLTVTVTNLSLIASAGFDSILEICVDSCEMCPLSILSDTLLCTNDSIQITAREGNDYLWLPDYNISENDIQNPIFYPEVDTTYIVYYTDTAGCGMSDTVNIFVSPKSQCRYKSL